MPATDRARSTTKPAPRTQPGQHAPQGAAPTWAHGAATATQRAREAPQALTPDDVARLQQAGGNAATVQLLRPDRTRARTRERSADVLQRKVMDADEIVAALAGGGP